MNRNNSGWEWLEGKPSPDDEAEAANRIDTDLAGAFARCFRGRDGALVIRYLRTITIERILGPNVPEALLRYVEGQRRLVAHMCTLIERAHGPSATKGLIDTFNSPRTEESINE